MDTENHQVTKLLDGIRANDPGAVNRLMDLVFRELHAMAAAKMRHERPDHTLQPTALVGEAYLRLFGSGNISLANRRAFFGAAAEAMRRILVEHARARGREKRGGKAKVVSLEGAEEPAAGMERDVTVDPEWLSEALDRLAMESPSAAEALKLSCFGGLTKPQIAEVLECSERKVYGDLAYARALLYDWHQSRSDAQD
jgi:RNA polymerase sigma-70 factor, ECF subfamily